jgi:hypothetical protein
MLIDFIITIEHNEDYDGEILDSTIKQYDTILSRMEDVVRKTNLEVYDAEWREA